jgi:hypothetical protein
MVGEFMGFITAMDCWVRFFLNRARRDLSSRRIRQSFSRSKAVSSRAIQPYNDRNFEYTSCVGWVIHYFFQMCLDGRGVGQLDFLQKGPKHRQQIIFSSVCRDGRGSFLIRWFQKHQKHQSKKKGKEEIMGLLRFIGTLFGVLFGAFLGITIGWLLIWKVFAFIVGA